MLPKTKRVVLKGKKLAELNRLIHERDGYCCIICGAYVDLNEKFHHEPCGKDKSDEITKGVTLCYKCHQERHFGKLSQIIKEKCKDYLRRKYE